MPTAAPAFTDGSELASWLSQEAVDLRADHSPETAVAKAAARANNEVYHHLGSKYDATALLDSSWVCQVADELALYWLCRMREGGMPPEVAERAKEIRAELKDIQTGKVDLPTVAVQKSALPGVVNQAVRLGTYPSVRTERPRSTSTEGYHRKIDPSADVVNQG